MTIKQIAVYVSIITFLSASSSHGKTTVTPDDFTFVGGFRTPLAAKYVAGLALRDVNGVKKLYTISTLDTTKGNVYEFEIPGDGVLSSSLPFGAVNVTNNFGDIFQDKLVTTQPDGGGGTFPKVGVANGATIPSGLWWDKTDQRMYWSLVIAYENTSDPPASNPTLGYSTLNDTTHTGTGIGSWRLDLPSPNGVGGRFGYSGMIFPDDFATTYLGGRRIGVGFGGGTSIITNGLPSIGPALVAVNSPTLSSEDHLDYLSVTPTELISHWADDNRMPRPSGYPGYNAYNDYGDDLSWYFTEDKTKYGVWIDAVNKDGLIVFANMGAGNANTTIASVSSNTVFTVVDAGDIGPGDVIYLQTVGSSYPYPELSVASVSGNTITLSSGDTGDPMVGGFCISGNWYAGGSGTSRWWTPWIIYSTGDIAAVAQGENPETITPTYHDQVALPSVSYPLPGTPKGSASTMSHSFRGAVFDPDTSRLYLAALAESGTAGQSNVFVYQLNDTPPPNAPKYKFGPNLIKRVLNE